MSENVIETNATIKGVRVTQKYYKVPLNIDDPDVATAYPRWNCSSAGPDYEEVVARGKKKAIFTQTAEIEFVPTVKLWAKSVKSLGEKSLVVHIKEGQHEEARAHLSKTLRIGKNIEGCINVAFRQDHTGIDLSAEIDGEHYSVGCASCANGSNLETWTKKAGKDILKAVVLQRKMNSLGVRVED